jgi:magnesium chelatase family protein
LWVSRIFCTGYSAGAQCEFRYPCRKPSFTYVRSIAKLKSIHRFNTRVTCPQIPPAELRPDAPPGECSDVVRARVIRACEAQRHRAGRCNAHLDQSETNAVCRLAPDDQAMLKNAIDLLQLSARSMHRILRVARTIADLAGSHDILGPHVAEAIGYRRRERAAPSRVA